MRGFPCSINRFENVTVQVFFYLLTLLRDRSDGSRIDGHWGRKDPPAIIEPQPEAGPRGKPMA